MSDRPDSSDPSPRVIDLAERRRLAARRKLAEEAAHQAELEREDRKALRRAQLDLWGEGTMREHMVMLSHRFPSLCTLSGAGVGPWDPDAVLAYACGPVAHAERLSALFVLHVWDPEADWNELAHLPGDEGEPPLLEGDRLLQRFNIFDAWAVWDYDHQQAALAWFTAPFWP